MSTKTSLPTHDQTMINTIQHRANAHGFALAMSKPAITDAHLRHVERSLEDIITELD